MPLRLLPDTVLAQEDLRHLLQDVSGSGECRGVPGDAEDTGYLVVVPDRQIESGTRAGQAVVRCDDELLEEVGDDLLGAGVMVTDTAGICARDDRGGAVNEIDVSTENRTDLGNDSLSVVQRDFHAQIITIKCALEHNSS